MAIKVNIVDRAIIQYIALLGAFRGELGPIVQVCLVRLPQELLVRERTRIADHVGEDVRHLGNVGPDIFDLVHLDHSHRLRPNDQILHETNLDGLLHLVPNE